RGDGRGAIGACVDDGGGETRGAGLEDPLGELLAEGVHGVGPTALGLTGHVLRPPAEAGWRGIDALCERADNLGAAHDHELKPRWCYFDDRSFAAESH